MKSEASLSKRLAIVLIPTFAQAAVSIILALLIIIAVNLSRLLRLLGVDPAALKAASDQFQVHSSGVLTTQVAASTALITFWATVGMIAYIICWSAYNLMIEARNEVTLETQYTNRGHWRGPYETIALKIVGGLLLLASFVILKPGLALWLGLAQPAFIAPDATSVAAAAAAVLGLALQLYLVLAMVIFTFTPWYRKEVFTQ